jgi:adenylate cyclase
MRSRLVVTLVRLWPTWPPRRLLRPIGGSADNATDRLIRAAEVAAERRAGLVRIATAAFILAAIFFAVDELPPDAMTVRQQVRSAVVTLVLFGLVGVAGFRLARQSWAPRLLPIVTATADAALILGNLAYLHFATGISGDFFAAFPVIWVVPITIAASAIHYRPRLQAYVAGLYVFGIAAIALLAGQLDLPERREALADLPLQFGPPPNAVRIVMILAMAVILVLVARQGRGLLDRAVRETTLRVNLTRYLPRELAPILSEESFAEMRAGRRVPAVLLFVDIRDSSKLAEGMDPTRLAIFITSFRRRVLRAAARHGAVIDKFVGDGAFLLFGVPDAKPDDARRALACGRQLCTLVERWNEKRGFKPALKIGVGVHRGEVFCGVVGDEARLEFTVLGEAVNTTSRIETATKSVNRPLLASQEVVAEAGEEDQWIEVASEPLRGVSRSLTLMAPRDPPPA